jgi:hypothetical protein
VTVVGLSGSPDSERPFSGPVADKNPELTPSRPG